MAETSHEDDGRCGYGSDVVVDALQSHNIRYLALNPGASFRGLHDSLVNYGNGKPEIILVPHEKVAVGIAHGYAKATGEAMGVVLHDLVGLLHGTMGMYYAYVDRAPVLVLGGAGPMDAARRRPWIDWIHTANVQNTAVRDYTKWDDHPFSVDAIPDSLARAYRIATTPPQGPVYVALDADLQEQELTGARRPPQPPEDAPTPLAPDPAALQLLARQMCRAERPLIVAGSLGRDATMWPMLVALAELLGAAVIDTNVRHNFPNKHPLNATGCGLEATADALLLLDVKDVGQHTQLLGKEDRGQRPKTAAGARIFDVGFGDIGISSWSADYGSLFRADMRVIADTSIAVPLLLEQCRMILGETDPLSDHREARRREIAKVHATRHRRWEAEAEEHVAGSPMSTARLVAEVGRALQGRDWVLTAGTGNGWATRLWNFDRHDRHPGRSLGTATQIGISLGVALAHKGSGRLVVDLQPDGDLMFDTSALWVAAHHKIPMLVVMVNNRAYNNDWVHQKHMAAHRGNPVERASIGITIEDPEPDFAAIARGLGWHAHGPVLEPDEIRGAVEDAIRHIEDTGLPALVDIVCRADS